MIDESYNLVDNDEIDDDDDGLDDDNDDICMYDATSESTMVTTILIMRQITRFSCSVGNRPTCGNDEKEK